MNPDIRKGIGTKIPLITLDVLCGLGIGDGIHNGSLIEVFGFSLAGLILLAITASRDRLLGTLIQTQAGKSHRHRRRQTTR